MSIECFIVSHMQELLSQRRSFFFVIRKWLSLDRYATMMDASQIAPKYPKFVTGHLVKRRQKFTASSASQAQYASGSRTLLFSLAP